MPPDDDKTPPPRLNRGEAEQVLQHVAALTGADLPLADGLRAAASEAPQRRLAVGLNQIADALSRGETLEAALLRQSRGFPGYLSGVVAAAVRTGRLGVVLEDVVSYSQRTHRLWWNLLASLIYPLLILSLAAVMFLFMMLFVVPTFTQMFRDFELQLPAATLFVMGLSESLVYLLAGVRKWFSFGAVGLILVGLLAAWAAMGPARWRRFLATMPVVGPLFAWSGAAAFAHLLALLIDNGLSLPEALVLTGDGVRDPNVRQACRIYADGTRGGASLSQLISDGRQLPQTIVPFVAWGERHGDLGECLQSIGDIYLERIRLRAALLRSISPSLIFVFVALVVVFSIAAIMLPLFSLITGLA